MSSSNASASPAAEENSVNHSVFDFLYNDSRRIGSYLAQFEVGHLQQLVTTDEAASQTGETSGREFGVGATAILGGKSSSNETEGVSKKDILQRTYDPYWSNARAFLNYLNQSSLIKNNVSTAGMGSFVLVSGDFVVVNLHSLQPIWGLPNIKKLMLANAENNQQSDQNANRQQRRSQGNSSKKEPTEAEMLLEFMPHMPHSTQGYILGDDFTVWCTLANDSLVGLANDLVLKHGAKSAGRWNILGILDAEPDDGMGAPSILDQINMDIYGKPTVAGMVLTLSSPMRQVLGRPANAYGVTPLLVFREVGKGR